MSESEQSNNNGNNGKNDNNNDESSQSAVHDESDMESSQQEDRPKKQKKVFKLSMTKTQNFNETLLNRGVVYIARVPPRMNPTKIGKKSFSLICRPKCRRRKRAARRSA